MSTALSIRGATEAIEQENLERARIARGAGPADPVGGPSPFNLLAGVMPVGGMEPPVLGTRELLEGYESMPWLRAVASMVGDAVASTDWKIYARLAQTPSGEEALNLVPTEGGFVWDKELLREAIAGAVDGAIARRIQAAKGYLGDRVIADRLLQRLGMASRWKRLQQLARAKQVEEIVEHPFFDALENPNPIIQSRHVLLKITQLHLDLVGDAFWIKERNALGVVTGYWPVPPYWVWQMPVPSDRRYWVGFRAWQAYIPAKDMLWFHEAAPANPYGRGSGVGWALGDELEVDEYAAKMAKQLFFNQARPDFVVFGFADITEKNRLERDWVNRTQGFWRAHKPYFMTGEPKFHEFQRPNMEQLVYPNLRKVQRDIIIQTWGVPPEIFGISEHGLLAKNNYEGAEYHFARRVVNPRAERIRGTLQREFAQEFDARGVIDFESHVADDKAFALAVIKAAPWAFDDTEIRELAAMGPGEGAHLVPLNSYTTSGLLDQSARPQAKPPEPPPKDEERLVELEIVRGSVEASTRSAESISKAMPALAEAMGDAISKAIPRQQPAPPPNITTGAVTQTAADPTPGLAQLGGGIEKGLAAFGEAIAKGLADAAERTRPAVIDARTSVTAPDQSEALMRAGEALGTGLVTAGAALATGVKEAAAAVRSTSPQDVRLVGSVPLETNVTGVPETETTTDVTVRNGKGGIEQTRARTKKVK